MSTDTWLPLSRINMVLVAAVVAGAITTGILGNWGGTAVLGIVAAFVVGAARYARRTESRDIARINALEYRDERDRDLARRSLSVVGAAALILSALTALVSVVMADRLLISLSCGQLFILAIIWGITNSRVVATR